MDSSVAIICWQDKILLFHRDNISSIPDPDCWSLPGGGFEEGEDHNATINRELAEEISYVPGHLEYIGYCLEKDTHRRHVFFSYVSDDEVPNFQLGDGEGQEIRFFSMDEIKQVKLTPRLKILMATYGDILSEDIRVKRIPEPYRLGLER